MATEYKIEDFLKRFKRPISLEANKEYKLVTISSKHRGIKLRELKKGALIKSKMYEVKSGDFIISGIDARNGAFGIIPAELDGGIVTNDFWYFKIDESIILKRLFLELTATTWFDEICTRGSDGTTNRVRLQKGKFFNQRVLLPDFNEQEILLKHLLSFKEARNKLKREIKIQNKLIQSLKQSILQEAIQGNLSKDWCKENPNFERASVLLERIKAEKAQLIKEKKIKKEKTLLPISKEEIPFEIPKNWIWCRLGELYQTTSGGTPLRSNVEYWNGNIKWYKSGELNDGLLSINAKELITEKGLKESSATLFPSGTLLIAMYGATAGKLAILKNEATTNQAICGFYENSNLSTDYLFNYLLANRSKMIKESWGMSQPNISQTYLRDFVFALPPIEEQKAIVKKIDILMQKCQFLEKEIETSETNIQMLMRAVLKEAFESKEIDKTKVVELPSKPTNVDYYKRTLLATEIVWQLQKEPTLGHLKLQKLIYLAQESSTMQLPTNFLQQVAGPYDPKMARSLDKQMKTKKWFEYKKTELLKFKPLEKAGEHQTDFEKFFANEKGSIQYIIDTFKTAKSDSIELVGTLYACWKKLIEEKQMITDEIISKRFYEWSEAKAKFEPNRIIKALRWMETKGIVPEKANA